MACGEDVKSKLKLMMGHVHVYVTAACKEYFEKFRRHVYVTPRSYLSFIQGYKELYSKKWGYTQELAVSIQVGRAAAAVDCGKLYIGAAVFGCRCSSLVMCSHTPHAVYEYASCAAVMLLAMSHRFVCLCFNLHCTVVAAFVPTCRLACKRWLRPRRM